MSGLVPPPPVEHDGPITQHSPGRPEPAGVAADAKIVPELDGLRFIAILIVLLWHASLRAARYVESSAVEPPLRSFFDFFPHGEVGVSLFFAISGFVISRPFLSKGRSNWCVLDFYRRRFWRIYPPYAVALTLCWFALALVGHRPSFAQGFGQAGISLNESFLASALCAHAVFFDSPSRLNPPLWSIEVEAIFYAAFPLIVRFIPARAVPARRTALLSLAMAALITAAAAASGYVSPDLRGRWALSYHLYLFVLGVWLASVERRAERIARSGWYDLLFAVGGCALVFDGLLMTGTDAKMTGFWYALVIQVHQSIAIVLIFFGATRGVRARSILRSAWLRAMGSFSYSVYLTHIVTMTVVSESIVRYVSPSHTITVYVDFVAANIVSSIVVGYLFFLAIERRFSSARRRPAAMPALHFGTSTAAPRAGPGLVS